MRARCATARRIACAALVAGSAAAVRAEMPIHVSYGFGDAFDVPFCGFEVRVEISGAAAWIGFLGPDGSVQRTIEPAAGPISAHLTRLDTGAVVDLHPSGPGMSEVGADSFTYVTVGPWLSFVDPRSGQEGIYLLAGRQTKVFTPTSFTWRFDGRVDDLCARLAAATPR